jgi:hypothetical protein
MGIQRLEMQIMDSFFLEFSVAKKWGKSIKTNSKTQVGHTKRAFLRPKCCSVIFEHIKFSVGVKFHY